MYRFGCARSNDLFLRHDVPTLASRRLITRVLYTERCSRQNRQSLSHWYLSPKAAALR